MTEQDKSCTLFLARHGQTEWNVQGLIQGHQDSPLTQAGERQAYVLAKELGGKRFDAMFSSDLF